MSNAFVDYEATRGIAFITLNHPPVNSFSLGLRHALSAALERAARAPTIEAVVLSGAGRGFCAGGDIHELGTPAVLMDPRLSLHLHPQIESLDKPVVAALHGFAIGGGFETAMVCHGRVACEDTRMALPEVKLGIIPLSGTQRLPRLIGIKAALDIILSAQPRLALDFAGTPLFDRILTTAQIAGLRDAASEVAREILARGKPYPLVRDCSLDGEDSRAVLAAARAKLLQSRLTPAHHGALEAIAAAAELPDFDAGLHVANRICEELLAAQEVRQQS